MNKAIVIPVFFLLVLSLFAVAFDIADNPSGGTVFDTSEGKWVEMQDGSIRWLNSNTGSSYGPVQTLDGRTFDPRDDPKTAFKLYNTDTGKVEEYRDMDDFLDDHSTGSHSIIDDVFNTKTFWYVIVAILSAGVAFGVQVFGSGLSEFAQRTLFLTLGWGAVWAFLSITSYGLLSSDSLGLFGPLLFTGLTLIFILGIVLEVTGGGD